MLAELSCAKQLDLRSEVAYRPGCELLGATCDAELAAGLGDLAVADGHFFLSCCGTGNCCAKLLSCRCGIKTSGGNGAVG